MNNYLNCNDVSESLISYLYNELAPSAQINFENHLHSCSSCQQSVSELKAVCGHFHSLPKLEVPSILIQKILIQSRELGSQSQTSAFQKFVASFWNAKFPVASIAWSFLALFAGFQLFTHFDPSTKQVASNDKILQPLTQINTQQLGPQVAPNYLREQLFQNSFDQQAAPSNGFVLPVQRVAAQSNFEPQLGKMLGDIDSQPAALTQPSAGQVRATMEFDADSLLMRGRRFKSMGRVDLALKDFETIYSYYPEYTYMGDVLMYRSQCYAILGNNEKAKESLQEYAIKYPTKKDLINDMVKQLDEK